MAFLTRSVAVWLALACVLGFPEIAQAESSLRGARVVWVRGDRVYVASPDPVTLEPGTILEFKNRGKVVATAEVTAVHDGELIAAKLTSGSLAKVKRLEKLEVAAEPTVVRRISLLRVGYPAAGRKSLLFDCSKQSLDSSLLQGAYKAEATGGQTYRLVRDSTHSVAAAWPDTLLVRLFEEVADEEIALERGDLDAAVFWPGEASSHIREVTHWEGQPSGLRAEGFLAATAWSPGAAGDSSRLRVNERQALALMNQVLFRGDLAPWAREPMPAPVTVATRFEADSSLLGRQSIERFLNQALGLGATPGSARVVHLQSDYPTEGLDRQVPLTYVFEIRCPVLSAPRLRSYLTAIGTDPLANLFQCPPAARKP